MHLKVRCLLATAAAILPFCKAQTFTSCDPTKKVCPPDPAFGETFSSQFKADGIKAGQGWKVTSGSINYGPEGVEMTISKKGDSPTIQTDGYLFFGQVEVKMRAAPGTGIVSSIVLESDDLDEVDWEMLGGKAAEVQTNYFGKGNTTTYDRGMNFLVNDVVGQMHTYTLDWTKDAIVWSIDGKAVRTLNFADAVGGKNFPQTPMNVRIGSWAGGDPDNNPGVISWAGGKTDFSKGPFTMFVESVKVVNHHPGKEYFYKDKSGSFESIDVKQAGQVSNNSTLSSAAGFHPAPTGNSEKPPCSTPAPVSNPPADQPASSPPIFTPSAASQSADATSATSSSVLVSASSSNTALPLPGTTPAVPVPGELTTTCTREQTFIVTVTVPGGFTPPPFSSATAPPPFPIFSPSSNCTSMLGTAPPVPVPTTFQAEVSSSDSTLFVPSVILTDSAPPAQPTSFSPGDLATSNFTVPLSSLPPEATGAAPNLDNGRPAFLAAGTFLLAIFFF